MAEAFLWGLLAAGSLLLGAVVALVRPPGRTLVGWVMAFGAGVLLSAVSFELVAKAVQVPDGVGRAAAGFFAGALVFTGGDTLIARAGYARRKDISGAAPPAAASATGLPIVLGALLDGIPESAILGLTLLQTGGIGVSMLVAVFVSNLPEGVAATAGLKTGGWSTSRIVTLWVIVAFVCAAASALGFMVLDGATPSTLAFIYAFAGGAILTMLATSMIPEAYEQAGRTAGLVTVLGFATAFGVDWLFG